MLYSIVHLCVMLLTFYLLALVCDYYFVPSLEKISHKLRLSSEFAWATLMAIGSSAPELFTSLFAVLNPHLEPSVWAGTIVWSAIFNILVIIGASVVIRKAKITWQPVVRDLFFYGLAILLLLLFFVDGSIEFVEVLIFLALYIGYIFVAKNRSRRLWYSAPGRDDGVVDLDRPSGWVSHYIVSFFDRIIPHPHNSYVFSFFVSIIIIALLTHFMVDAWVQFAHILHIPASIVGLTILAAGTSVPDLLSSLNVARKWRGDMAITNAIWSNIFDILFGLWFPYLLYFMIYWLDKNIVVDGNNILWSIILLFATIVVVAFVLVMKRWHLSKRSWMFLILLYVCYIVYTVFLILS